MTGTLGGRRYRVAGRVVMGMEDAGETYYWNEFSLVGDDGSPVTLVYEETEAGAEWKLFTLFEPDNPMSAAEAASKHVGDMVNLDGTPRRVTMVDESRVYHIEGEAPEGVEVGDVARYFNAETGDKMLVASWTGDEIEFYWGADLPRGTVATAFGLRAEQLGGTGQAVGSSLLSPAAFGASADGVSRGVFKVVLALALAAIGFYLISSRLPGRSRAVVAKTAAPVAPLVIGSEGKLSGKTWRVRGHRLVEIAQVGRVFDRHEYELADDAGGQALLVCGLKPGDADWVLFTLVEPAAPLTPVQAAALRVGGEVNLDGWVGLINRLFQSVVRQAEGTDLPDLRAGAVYFGVEAKSGSTPLLVRWNQGGIAFYRGETLPAKQTVGAFTRSPAN